VIQGSNVPLTIFKEVHAVLRRMKLSPKQFCGPIILTAFGCSDTSTPVEHYGAMQQALTLEQANSGAALSGEELFTDRCTAEFEPTLLVLDIDVHDAEVSLTVHNTTDDDVGGTVDVYAMSSREIRESPVAFDVGGLDSTTLTVPLDVLGVDKEVDLAIISAKLIGTFAKGGSTVAVNEFVYDLRTIKPELEEIDAEARLERVGVAIVRDGVEAERLAAAAADTTDEILDGPNGDAMPARPARSSFQPFAVNKVICFDANLILLTAGFGEDFWNSTNTTVWARGQRIDAQPPGGSSYSTWWLDNNGCISGNFATGTWSFKAYPVTRILKGGAVWTNILNKRYPDDAFLITSFTANVNTSSDQFIAYSAAATLHISHVAHEALRNRINDLSYRSFPATINIRNSYLSPPLGGSKYDPPTQFIYISSNDSQDKWAVSHEVGHFIQYNEAEESSWGYNNSRSGVPCTTPSTGHFTDSREFNSAAGVEGFASYWAALVFNDKGFSDCWVRLAGDTISCVDSSAGYPVRFMETNCGTAPFTGDGNETDWQRAYWDITREDTLGTVPAVSELLTMMRNGSSWGASNHYQRMDAAAALASTPQYLESKWNGAASTHGIDW
jgi:hypothetical protein